VNRTVYVKPGLCQAFKGFAQGVNKAGSRPCLELTMSGNSSEQSGLGTYRTRGFVVSPVAPTEPGCLHPGLGVSPSSTSRT